MTLTKEKKTKRYILQIDQEKVFDKVDHEFLYKTMNKMGFSKNFIQFIKILYKNNISYIINNGFMSPPIQLLRSLRQGCPLSLPLYIIQGEIITTNINNNENVKGIKIPNNKKDIKISQYADDSNFLLSTQESIQQVIKIFKKLRKATGSTINLEKTKVLPINTDQIPHIQQNTTDITILEQNQYIILCIFISENLNEAIMLNWQNSLEKMENHIKKMSPRQLSLYGKSILINNLILAKATFLSNIFSIPEKIKQKLHKIIFQYLWENKISEPIARKILFLPKNKGGFNIEESEAHNLAMHIKHLLTLKQTENQSSWMHIAIYWLGKDIYYYNKDFNHLKNNKITKTNKMPPFYYRDLIHYIKTQNSNIPNLQNKTKIIYKNIIEKDSQNDNIFGGKKWKERITNFNFNQIWKNTYFSHSHTYAKDLLFKFVHHAIKTNNFIYKISRDKAGLTPNCEHCHDVKDNIHLFTT